MAMKPHRATGACKLPDADLAEFVHGEDLGCTADVVDMIDGICLVLHDKDPLRASLEAACQEGGGGRIAEVSIPRTGGGRFEPGHKYKLVVIIGEKKSGAPIARLAHRTRSQIGLETSGPAGPERQQGMLNLGLGVAIFAVMSVTSLAILAPPYSLAMAAGALAPAGVMLARAARRRARSAGGGQKSA